MYILDHGGKMEAAKRYRRGGVNHFLGGKVKFSQSSTWFNVYRTFATWFFLLGCSELTELGIRKSADRKLYSQAQVLVSDF